MRGDKSQWCRPCSQGTYVYIIYKWEEIWNRIIESSLEGPVFHLPRYYSPFTFRTSFVNTCEITWNYMRLGSLNVTRKHNSSQSELVYIRICCVPPNQASLFSYPSTEKCPVCEELITRDLKY